MRKFSNHRGPTPYQNSTQLVRAHLGLTQQNLADLMDVSRSAVALDERGDRILPWPQAQLLEALRQVLPAPAGLAPVPAVAPAVLTAADRDELDFQRQGLRLKLRPLEQELARAQTLLAQACLWQQALPTLRATFPATNELAHRWLDRFEHRAANILENNTGTPVLLGVRLAALRFEIAEITRLLGDAPDPT